MDVQTYDQTHALADILLDEIRNLLEQGKLPAFEARLRAAEGQLPEGCSLSVNLSVGVFDPSRDRVLKTGDAGLLFEKNHETHACNYAPTPAKYLVEGVMAKVPHDHCPHCWSRWNFKSRFKECPKCGYQMGKEIKLLVDSDVCPRCENSKISYAQPACSECGYVADQAEVVWG